MNSRAKYNTKQREILISFFKENKNKRGRLIYLHCEEIEQLQKHIESEHSFKIEPKRTVFYGLCDSCR